MQVKGFFYSFLYAWNGICHCVKHERNFRIHLFAALTVLLIAPYYQFTNDEMIKLLLVIFLVLIAEMFNTSMEELVNLITDTYHEKAKIIKDVAAGAVALGAICSVSIAGFLFWRINVILSILQDIASSSIKILSVLIYFILGFLFIFKSKEKKKNV